MNQRTIVAAGVVMLTAAGFGVSRAADASPVPRSSALPSACIEFGAQGHQIWHGPSHNDAVGALADALGPIADENHGTVSGVALCSDLSGVAIFIAHPSESVRAQISAAGAKHPHAQLYVVDVANGLTAQLAASQRVMATDRSGEAVVGLGPDIYTGGLRVDVRSTSWPVSDALRQRVTAAATANGTVVMPVIFRVSSGEAHNLPLKR